MRKAPQRLFLAATLVTILNFQSCKKYEDGPAFTLKTKKSRLVREWEVVKIYDNSGEQFFPYMDSDYSLDIEFEFEKDGDFEQKVTYSYDGYSYSYAYKGDWEFSGDKEELEIELGGSVQDWEIKRLTSKELWFEDQSGNEWELDAK